MNTDAVRERNARKRAKLRAKKRGEVFTHVFIDSEVVGYTYQFDWDGAQSLQFVKRLPAGIEQDWLVGKLDREYKPLCIDWVLINSENSTEELSRRISRYVETLEGYGAFDPDHLFGVTRRITVAVTKDSQRRVKEWLVTPADEAVAVVADVVAAVSTLVQSQNPLIS